MKYFGFNPILILLLLRPHYPVECGGFQANPATLQLLEYANRHQNASYPFAENTQGIVYPSLTATLAVGTEGPVLLQDVFFIEKIQSFNRERIPERVVHAKGAGAFGYFEVTNDISQYTRAGFLRTVGQTTRVAVRFSTVEGESGSSDTAIGPKGFAIKFYTQDGIHDLVGLSLQVFGLRDPMLFVDLNRSRKRNPQTHLNDPTSFWDFTSLRAENTMNTLYVFSEIGRPKSYTYIDGAGIHAFKMVNNRGSAVYVKFHWTSNQENKQYFTPDESITVGGTNADALTQDLYDRIASGQYPSWNLSIQVMTFDQAANHPQNPFDATKFWDQDDYPLIPVGRIILNENPIDYFTQVEEIAFDPGHMVPGIEPSPDRLLIGRMFAYTDAQTYRLGTNFAQIPVNRCPFRVFTYERDGFMNVGTNGRGSPNYHPNSFNGLKANTENYYKQSAYYVSGDVNRLDTGNEDNFSQPRLYVDKIISPYEREIIVNSIADFLGQAAINVQRNFLNNIAYNISAEFGNSLKNALIRQNQKP